ncbi:MAG: hypothetical protein QMD71_00375 [bacterium]|nr:hypothetical protein [bacterium]
MAKYIGSIIGTIYGSIGEFVFSNYKGIRVVKKRNRERKSYASIEMVKKAKRDELEMAKIPVKEINAKMVFAAVSWIGKELFEPIIVPVWEPICRAKRVAMSGHNLFMKYNITPLYQSIPDKDKLYGSKNMPDIKVLTLTQGRLETAQITKANYLNGKIELQWKTECYFNGKQEDEAYLIIIQWTINEKDEIPDAKPWTTIKIWNSGESKNTITPIAKRGDGKAYITISTKLNRLDDFIIYLFFYNNKIGYSPTTTAKIQKY